MLIMSGLLSHSKNSIPVWFCLFWRAKELHALSYVLLTQCMMHCTLLWLYTPGGINCGLFQW